MFQNIFFTNFGASDQKRGNIFSVFSKNNSGKLDYYRKECLGDMSLR